MKKRFINIIILIIIIIGTYFIVYKYNEKVIMDSYEEMKPFSKNNNLYRLNINIKITRDLPKIEAASAFYPFASNFVQNAYIEKLYSEELLKLVSTTQAYSDIIKEKTDIIIATAPSEEQKEMILNSNVSLEYKILYFEPLVFFVNKENNIENLSIKEIQDIYYNNLDNWNTYQLEKNNGSQTCFESIVNNNTINQNHYEIHTMPEIIDRVAEDKNGIGYAFNSYYSKMHPNKKTKAIRVNEKSIEDTDYPLLFEVYMIYRTDNKNENISKIVNWLETENYQEFVKSIK